MSGVASGGGGAGGAYDFAEESGGTSPQAVSSPPMTATQSLPDEPVVLTAASLKHVKRQRDALAEEKVRLLAEIEALKAKLREQRERVVVMEGELQEAVAREAVAREEAQQARERAERLEALNLKLEDLLAQREAELARLREALEEQRHLAREHFQAAPPPPPLDDGSKEKLLRLQSEFEELRHDRDFLKQELGIQADQNDRLKQAVATAMAAAERAMAMHALHAQHLEQLRTAKLEESIKSKMELHISMPKVTLNYNNSPPLLVSAEVALSEDKVRVFLERHVFPHLEPMWVTLDNVCPAPDGSSSKEYAKKMLDRLSAAIKAFVERAQASDDAQLAPPRGAAGR